MSAKTTPRKAAPAAPSSWRSTSDSSGATIIQLARPASSMRTICAVSTLVLVAGGVRCASNRSSTGP